MIIRIVHPIPTPPLDDFCTFLNAARTCMPLCMYACAYYIAAFYT